MNGAPNGCIRGLARAVADSRAMFVLAGTRIAPTERKPVKQVARFLSALRERIRFREASSSPNCRRLFVVIAARGRA